jgi:DNA-binding transcriptional LysR family regulator
MATLSTAKLEHVRLRDLLLIERVHNLGSLRQVAEVMCLTQPAVTQALQSLEEAFGAQLVERSSSGASLSSTGMAVLHRLKAMHWEAMAALAVAQQPQSPTITLGISQFTGLALVPNALAGFLQTHADVHLDIRENNSPALWQQLTHGKVDAIVSRMPGAEEFQRMSELIAYDVLGTERLLLVAASDHPLVSQGFSKSSLASQRWVLPPVNSYARNTLNEWFLHADVPAPVAAMTSSSFQTNIRLVAASHLLTVIPESTLVELSATLQIAVLPTDSNWDGVAYFFACRKSSLVNPLIRALRAHFAAPG